MQNPEQMTLEEMEELVKNSRAKRFSVEGREAFYELLAGVLKNQRYGEWTREQKGIVRQFFAKVTGRSRAQSRSRAQISRLIGRWMRERSIQARPPKRRRFPTR